ncbi:MAG: MFS transporter [Terriglobales bacterium]
MAFPFRALRHRNFQLFVGGQLISLIGTWMQNIAQAWLVYRLSHSAWQLGLIGFAGQIPIFLFAPIAGVVADRVNRRHLIIATQTLSIFPAAILAIATFTGHATVGLIFAMALFLGLVNAFDIPGRQSFLIEMVAREDLMNAIALNSSMFNGARLVGPAIAGMLVAWVGEAWCFSLNAVSYLAVIAGLLAMRIPALERPSTASSMLQHFTDGFRYVRSVGPISGLLLLLGTVSLATMPYTVLMPIFADQIFHAGARGLGILMGFTGAGALMGALLLAARKSVRGLGRVIAFCSLGVGAGLIGFGISHRFALSLALLFVVGLLTMVETAASNTLLQTMVSDEYRGRVMSFYSMMFMGMAPIGSLGAGWISHYLGAPHTVVVGGTFSVFAGLVFAARLPQLRIAARPLIENFTLLTGSPGTETASLPSQGVNP